MASASCAASAMTGRWSCRATWAQEAMAWAVDMGLIHGTDEGKLVPNSGATRAEVAVLLQRFAALK